MQQRCETEEGQRSSSSGMLSSSFSTITEAKAALVIQRNWRRMLQRRRSKLAVLVRRFAAFGITTAAGSRMNFREELVPLLKNRELIDAEWELVEQIMTVCRRRHCVRRRDNATAAPRTPRIFNVSYMIVCKTSSVFEVFGTVENALYVAANAMLERFEEIVKTLQQSNGDFGKVDKELSVGFVELVDVYFKCFEEWRAPDSKILKTRLKWALHAMHEAAAALENDDGETVVGMDIQRETVRLKEYYRKSFGEEALAELEEQLHGGNVVLETYPFRGEQGGIFKRTLSKLAHELLLDPDFRMDVQHMYEERPELRVEYDETFWNQVEEGLRSGADFRGVVQVLKQIKCGLMEVLPAEEWALIDEVIDTPPQAGRWSECVGLLEGIMHLILKAHQMPASPLREKLTVMWNERVDLASENPRMVCKALEFFLYGIEVSRLDMMNQKLRMLAPGLQQYGGVEFERLNFAEMVTQGMTRLDKTRAWIRRAVAERKSSALEVEEALLLIVVGDGDGEEIPETFWLDAGRLREQQKEFARQVRMGSFFVTLNGFLDRAGLQDLYKKEILPLLSSSVDLLKDDVVEELIETTIKGMVCDKVPRFHELAVALRLCVMKENPVYQLMQKRIRNLWLKVLRKQPIVDNEDHVQGIVRTMKGRIVESAQKLAVVMELNWRVHEERYKALIAEEEEGN